MTVTEKQLDLIRQSFAVLREDLEPKSVYFYGALFKYAPELKSMFREDDMAGQGMRFMSTLSAIVDNLHDPAALVQRYEDLGRSHAAMGVKASYFGPMGKALVDTLRQTLGDRFTPEMEEAWETAYADLSHEIVKLGHITDD